jgi:aminopeptidase N
MFFKGLLLSQDKVSGVLVRSFYFENDRKWGGRLLDYSRKIIPFYKQTLGFYPQPVLNIVPSYDEPFGGWPISPNIVGVHRGIDQKKDPAAHAEWIMAHEIAHQYWGFNYILEPTNYPQWYGIAMGIYTDRLYSMHHNVKKAYHNFYNACFHGISKGYNTTLMQTTDMLDKQGFDWNNIILHGKSWAVIRLLAHELGEGVFYQIYKHGLSNYGGTNVTAEIFKADCERISGKNLDLFFETWFYSDAHLEYAIKDVSIPGQTNEKEMEITIEKTGTAGLSEIEIAYLLNNGDTLTGKIDGTQAIVSLTPSFDGVLKKIILDPENKLPLYNKTSWTNH